MIPVIASGGASFKGAFAYYCHDKNAWTNARVAWTQTLNMMTDCAEKAWKVMAFTAKHATRLKEASGQRRTGRKLEKPVFAYSLSWHPEQKPDKQQMLAAAKASLAKLGLTEHEVAIVAHRDEPHAHCHLIVNRVHPMTGIAAKIPHSKRRLSDFAREYEREHGKIYCPKREENHRKRRKGQHTKYNDPIIAEAWERSSNAHGFQALLEAKGYHLARGRKRLVVVDPHGKAHNPTRHLKGIAKASEFNQRMATLNHDRLPTVEAITQKRRTKAQRHKERVQEFESQAAEAISKMTSEHHEQQARLLNYHHRTIETKRAELEDFYKLKEKQERIDTLKHQLEKPSMVQKLAFKIFRTDRKLKESIHQLEATKANAEQRLREAITPLEQDRDRELNGLKQRQAEELQTLTHRLEQWKPKERTLTQAWPRATHERSLSRSRENDTPSLGR